MGKLTLRQILILGVALGILLPAVVLGRFLVQDRYERELNLRVLTPMSQYADMLARAMAVPVWNVDKEVANEFVQAVMRNPEVVSVTVEDESQNQFVHAEVASRRIGELFHEERSLYLTGLENKRIGKVIVELSAGRLKSDLIADLLKMSGALLAQVLISFGFILLLFERRIVRPIKELQLATADLARGKLHQPLVRRRDDEIGNLSESLDKMRLDLGALITERDHKNEVLQIELNERLRAEQALRFTEEKFTAIFHASPVAMTVFRKTNFFVMVDVNDAWVRQFGWTHDEILHSREKQMSLWRNPDDFDSVISKIENHNEVHDYEAWLHCGHQEKILLCNISGRLVRLGDESLLVLVQEDITEKRHNESEILTLNTSLEHRVSERTSELEVANTELTIVLENLQRAQHELLRTEKMAALGSLVAGVAHELNTPIGISVTVASTMQQQTEAILQGMQSGMRRSTLDEFLQNSRAGTDILMRNLSKASELIVSFKQVAVDQTSANRRLFILDETVAENVLTLGPTIRKTRHEVVCDIPPKIMMDSYPGPLGQVLTNLINNAFIHAFDTDARGIVSISATMDESDTVTIVLTDNGKGIPEENLGRIFDPFFTTKLGQGGSGLGLNIVYNLVTGVLDGKITVESVINQGTTFTMSLPRLPP
ncbi:ATP-binding protein [Undibacterium sp. Rencai35W]|uniref:ATP-binding protein n=1 Tax=Undibacterium sp. Rencai35W TaxID=3413046 RepID=UPI003BF434CF